LKETPTIPDGFTSSCLLFISLLGLCFIALLTLNAAVPVTDFPWRKPLIGSIFSSICVLGTLSALFSSRCSRILHFKIGNGRKTPNEAEPISLKQKSLQFRGHHPSCGNFPAHVLVVANKTFCAGCLGLALGGTVSLVGTFLYFLADISLTGEYLFVFWAGFVGVACGLLQYHLLRFEKSFVHMFVNVIFVLGALMLLVGADALTGSLPILIYILALDIFWIYTRIALSQWNHSTICYKCKAEACPSYLRRSP